MIAASDIDEAQLAALKEIGAHAWAGVDAQALRTGAGSTEAEAARRLAQVRIDLAVVLPLLGGLALRTSRRTKAGRAFLGAYDRLAAEMLA